MRRGSPLGARGRAMPFPEGLEVFLQLAHMQAALRVNACDTIRTEGWPDRTLMGAVPCGLLGPRARAHAPIRSLAGLGRGRREALRVEASRWNRRQFFNGPSRRLMRIFADNPRR